MLRRKQIWILFFIAWIPWFLMFSSQGAVSFGDLRYDEELVETWDRMAVGLGLERTDLQNHYTSTYPSPKVIASVKQQTGASPGGRWKDLEYRNVYCVSHSGEAANNPGSSMICSSAWYAKEPWTLQNLPDYMRMQAGGDEYRLRFNFLMLAYGADYHAYQDGVNSSAVTGTADYYLCQGICTLTEDAQFTGDYGSDWLLYRAVVMDWASRFSPNGLGNAQVGEEMEKYAERVFHTVWHTAKLMAECTQSDESGFLFSSSIHLNTDGMYHAKFPVTEETRTLLLTAKITTYGDWHYRFVHDGLDFYSASGILPESEYLAKIDPESVNGIIAASIGAESVRELHQPVQIRGAWSLTYSQANLVSVLVPGTQILIGNASDGNGTQMPEFSGSGDVSRYKHTERWQADYIVNLQKLDAETGKTLEGAQFDIMEAFDDSQLDGSILEDDNWDNRNGSQFLRWNGWDSPYEEAAVDPCPKDQEITDEDGWLTEMESAGAGPLRSNGIRAHHDKRYYSYTKGYCGGHPEPDSDSEEDEDAWESYEEEIAICESLERQGGFFHSLDGGINQLREDRDRHYEAFVSLTYEYSARELTARHGYILHELPIETVTVHASQYYGLKERAILSETVVNEKIQRTFEHVARATPSEAAAEAEILDEDAEMAAGVATDSDATDSDADIRPLIRKRLVLERNYPVSSGRRAVEDDRDFSKNRLRSSELAPIPIGDSSYGGSEADWTFRVYDRRTEGEIHANKRDLDLSTGENENYDSYGDTQGDAVLKGAVYGLFAAEDIIHPDGKTGVVYRKGDLTAVAETNSVGDFSFTCYTEQTGGTFWVGRPLILGSYYIQELQRSEGYELSVFGSKEQVTNRFAWLNGGDVETKGTVSLVSVEEVAAPYMETRLAFESNAVQNGFDIQIKGIQPEMEPTFYRTEEGRTEVFRTWKEPVLSYEPVQAEAGTKVLIRGEGIPAQIGDKLSLPNGETVLVSNTILEPVNSAQVILTGERGAIPTFDIRYLPELTGNVWKTETEFLDVCNKALEDVGLEPVSGTAPYLFIPLGNDPTKWAENLYRYMESDTCPAYNAAFLETIFEQEGMLYGVLRYSFLKDGIPQPVVYSASDQAFYVKYDVIYENQGKGYLYRKIKAEELPENDYEFGTRLYRWIRINREKPEKDTLNLYENLEDLVFVNAQEFVSYWAYDRGEYLREEDGTIYQKEEVRYEEKEGYQEEQTFLYTPEMFKYHSELGTYECHIAPEQIPDNGELMLSIRYGDIYAGNRTGLTVTAVPSADVSGTYIQPVLLTYPGQEQVYEDAGTRKEPVVVFERVICEKVKITKKIEENDSWNYASSGFRFKIYLKSNLERLYRDSTGHILWLNREEEEMDDMEIQKELALYPERVPVIVTKKEDGYQQILEADETGYRYDKFFDAIAMANHDIWDDAEPEYSAFRPIGNEVNQSNEAVKNREISDAVRQFAIDWYLDEEVNALSVDATYTDALYDRALYQATVRALDYLKPFFDCDLDSIYAIAWDSQIHGGADEDNTTLSADRAYQNSGCVLSTYLPYGTYVVVEQQPQDTWTDWENRHYRIEPPKELVIPSRTGMDSEKFCWSVIETGSLSDGNDEELYRGYADSRWFNSVYRSKLRIEKLDGVTHENILHDEAQFRIYKGKHQEKALFYEEPTMICGSRVFLEAMKAEHIQPMIRGLGDVGPGNLYTGTVKAGTPICEEENLILSGTTKLRGQNVGYWETEESLEAGVYVICEVKPPDGYVRTDPIIVKLYSDQVQYYKEGNPQNLVNSERYRYEKNGKTEELTRIYIENEPITLNVEKRLAGDASVYVPGAMLTLYQASALEPSGDSGDYAYNNLIVERNVINDVIRMYRKDTKQDILYYDLSRLSLRKKNGRLYAFRGGIPCLEFVGEHLERVQYDRKNRRFLLGEGTQLYHLDTEGNRDALVNPDTGMAYVVPETAEKEGVVLVWPVKRYKDAFGNVSSMDKIRTSRIATVGETDAAASYITGSWKGETVMVSHQMETLRKTSDGKNQDSEPLLNRNSGFLEKKMNPVYDAHGLVSYYPASDGTYETELILYDRNGDFSRAVRTEFLEAYQAASFREEDDRLRHRCGESYVLENTWISSETAPNNPFQLNVTEGKTDVLQRIFSGWYILEEIQPPDGYLKGFPIGFQVKEQTEQETICMEEFMIQAEFAKTEEDGYTPVTGAEMALYDGKTDREIVRWKTEHEVFHLEKIPAGSYVWKELSTPEGFVTAAPKRIIIENTSQIQTYAMRNDHTRLEIEKYTWKNQRKKQLSGAQFCLYAALPKADGTMNYDENQMMHQWVSSDSEIYRDFIPAFEYMYMLFGSEPGTSVFWRSGKKEYRADLVEIEAGTTPVLLFQTSEGDMIRVTVQEEESFEYQFAYETLPQINDHACAWQTEEGNYRVEYLPVDTRYFLVEKVPPEGYKKSEDILITINNTAEIQRYSVENVPERLPEPELPAEPEKPTEPATPAEPEKPTESATPTEAEKPTEPATPTEPESPIEPDLPSESEASAEREEFLEPKRPSEPPNQMLLEKIGYISASYMPGEAVEWRSMNDYGFRWLRFLPHLGDLSELKTGLLIFILSVLGILICRKRQE